MGYIFIPIQKENEYMRGIQSTDKETIIRVINLKLKEYPDYDGSFSVVDIIGTKIRVSSSKAMSPKTVALIERMLKDSELSFLSF